MIRAWFERWQNDRWRKRHGWQIVKITHYDATTHRPYTEKTWVRKAAR